MVTGLNIGGRSINMKNIIKPIVYGTIFTGLAAVLGLATCQNIRTSYNPDMPVVITYPTPEPTIELIPYTDQTPTVEPTPEPTIVPTPTVIPTPIIVPNPTPVPTPIPTPVLTAYEKFQKNLDVGEFNSYFTEDFFNEIGGKKSIRLASYVHDALNNELSDYSDERIQDIEHFLRRGPHSGFIGNDILVTYFNDYYNSELEKSSSRIFYGYEKDEITGFLNFVKENPNYINSINMSDIDLMGDIFISSESMRNYFPEEIPRLIKHARDTEVYVTLDNKTIANFYDLIAFNSKNNEKSKLPIYVFTRSLFSYDVEKKMPNSENRYDNFRKNIENIQNISNHVNEFLENPDENFRRFLYKEKIYYKNNYSLEETFKWLLTGLNEAWRNSHKTGDSDWFYLFENHKPTRQALQIWTLSFGENRGHIDTATELSDIYNTLVGNELYGTYAFYPPWFRGVITGKSALHVTPEIRDILYDLSDEELLNEEWIVNPETRKKSAIDDRVPFIAIRTFPRYNNIFSITGDYLGFFDVNQSRKISNIMYNYIQRTWPDSSEFPE